jgi:multidrug resistance efflux pump
LKSIMRFTRISLPRKPRAGATGNWGPFGSRRNLVLAVIAFIALIAIAVNRMWIRADGIVAGELTAVSPIVQARIQQVFVTCLDHVTRGQQIAEFVNEATVQVATQQLKQLELLLLQARSQSEISAKEADAAQKLYEAQVALQGELVAVFEAQDELKKKQFVASLVWEKSKADVARGQADSMAAEFVYETKVADHRKAELDVEVLEKRIEAFKTSPELTGHFFLAAPKDGIVTECAAHPGEVIPAKTPIFQIFNPNDSYAIAFFDPSDSATLTIGQQYSLSISGIGEPVSGRIAGFYPELAALPSSLTRYFWQQEKWSQYAPVRIDFNGLSAEQRDRLRAWAQLSVSHWRLW